jgi:CheY-like chemotaxis protein
VARDLRGHRDTSKALVIAMTGYRQPEDIERARAAGFDHHVVKPVSLERILELVTQSAERRRAVDDTGSGASKAGPSSESGPAFTPS